MAYVHKKPATKVAKKPAGAKGSKMVRSSGRNKPQPGYGGKSGAEHRLKDKEM